MDDGADGAGRREWRRVRAAASAVRVRLCRARGTLAGGWYDIPSIAARAVAPVRERVAGILAARRRRR